MIAHKHVDSYQGISLSRGSGFLYIPPHALLQPFISCYTITFPADMPDAYAILPSASSTLIVSVSGNNIFSSIRGVNTKPCTVGTHANKMKLLLLVEFHVGCLYPFIKINQHELTDKSFPLSNLDISLSRTIETEMMRSESVDALIIALNRIFLARLTEYHDDKTIAAIKNSIILQNGNTNMRELSSTIHYSEKHMRRLFSQHVGTSPKTFSRIVRANYALRLLKRKNTRITDIAAQAGFFDQPHFIHDFKSVCGLSPQEYMRNMSVFYNDDLKL